MWFETSVVSTVPGTEAAYQSVALKAAVETSAPPCETFEASCNCQPEAMGADAGGEVWANTESGARIADNDTKAMEKERARRICKGVTPEVLLGCLAADSAGHTDYRRREPGIADD